jgi:Effector-associated domain 10
MISTHNLNTIFDRIANGEATEGDIQTLRQLLNVRKGQNSIQIGRYNVNVSKGRDFQIGDRIFQGADAETIKEKLREVLQEKQKAQHSIRKQYARFVQFLLVGVGVACILSGFTKLLTDDFIFPTKLLLMVGSLLLALICSYYVVSWKPNIPQSIDNSEINKLSKRVIAWKICAAVGMVGIPLSTVVLVHLWMNAQTNTIVTFANYYVTQTDPLVSKAQSITTKIQNILDDDIRDKREKDIEIKPIDRAFKSAEANEARAEAKDRRATISIWGQYSKVNPLNNQDKAIEVISFFEIFKRPFFLIIPAKIKDAYERNEQNKEDLKIHFSPVIPFDGLTPSEVNIKVNEQTSRNPISQNLAYLTNFVAGLSHYKSGLDHYSAKKIVNATESFRRAIKRLEKASEYLKRIQEDKSGLNNKDILDRL